MTPDDAVPDDALWRSVEATMRDVVLPALPADEEWARLAGAQLIGLARYARSRSHADLLSTYAGNAPPPQRSLVDGLGDFLGTAVAKVRRMSVGASRAMFDVTLADGDRVMVRVEQGGVFDTSTAREVATMEAIARTEIPVARVRAMETSGAVLGHPFFVMDFVVGDERPPDVTTLEAFVSLMDRLHALERPRGIPDGDQIERWAAVHHASLAPAVELLDRAEQWLHRNSPDLPAGGPCVVHGDPGPGNFVHGGQEILAVTDWEFCHVGHPNEDWGFLVTIRGARTMSRPEWFALLDRVAGVRLSDDEWRYWEAFNLFKGACANLSCLRPFVNGENPAPNMLAVGTAAHGLFAARLEALLAS